MKQVYQVNLLYGPKHTEIFHTEQFEDFSKIRCERLEATVNAGHMVQILSVEVET